MIPKFAWFAARLFIAVIVAALDSLERRHARIRRRLRIGIVRMNREAARATALLDGRVDAICGALARYREALDSNPPPEIARRISRETGLLTEGQARAEHELANLAHQRVLLERAHDALRISERNAQFRAALQGSRDARADVDIELAQIEDILTKVVDAVETADHMAQSIGLMMRTSAPPA